MKKTLFFSLLLLVSSYLQAQGIAEIFGKIPMLELSVGDSYQVYHDYSNAGPQIDESYLENIKLPFLSKKKAKLESVNVEEAFQLEDNLFGYHIVANYEKRNFHFLLIGDSSGTGGDTQILSFEDVVYKKSKQNHYYCTAISTIKIEKTGISIATCTRIDVTVKDKSDMKRVDDVYLKDEGNKKTIVYVGDGDSDYGQEYTTQQFLFTKGKFVEQSLKKKAIKTLWEEEFMYGDF